MSHQEATRRTAAHRAEFTRTIMRTYGVCIGKDRTNTERPNAVAPSLGHAQRPHDVLHMHRVEFGLSTAMLIYHRSLAAAGRLHVYAGEQKKPHVAQHAHLRSWPRRAIRSPAFISRKPLISTSTLRMYCRSQPPAVVCPCTEYAY